MSKTDYKYCIGAGAPLCSQCKRHRPYTQSNTPEQKEWTMVTLDPTTGFCQMCDPKEGEWISTQSALPPLKTRVLIAETRASKRSIRIARYLGTTDNGNHYWSAQSPYDKVTHWQPLPQLPK